MSHSCMIRRQSPFSTLHGHGNEINQQLTVHDDGRAPSSTLHGHGSVCTYSFLYHRPLSARTLSTSSRSSLKDGQQKCRYGTSVILVKSVAQLNYVIARPWLLMRPKARVGYLAGCMHVYRYICVYFHMLMRMHTHIFMHI